MRRVLFSLFAALLAVCGIVFVVASTGVPLRDVASGMLSGAVGDRYAVFESITRAVPLLMTALAVVVAFRAGAWNIGGEGQFIVGGIAALLASRAVNGAGSAIFALCAAGVAGALWAAFPAVMKVRRDAPEVLTTILLNFVAIHLLGWMVNGPLQETGAQYPQSDAVPDAAQLSRLGATSVHSGAIIAVIAAAVSWYLLFRTREGLRLRAVGLNPAATEFAGVRAAPRIVSAMLLSGALAGMAGGIELLGVTQRLYERFAVGYGYSGITVALLAQTNPLASIVSAFFISALRGGAAELQRSAGVSSAVATLGEGIAVVALIAFARRERS